MKIKEIVKALMRCDQEAEADYCLVTNFDLRCTITEINRGPAGEARIDLEATSPDNDEAEDTESFLNKIHAGRYDHENGTAQFKADVLFHYGEEHELTFSRIFRANRTLGLAGRALLEETIGDFVKEI